MVFILSSWSCQPDGFYLIIMVMSSHGFYLIIMVMSTTCVFMLSSWSCQPHGFYLIIMVMSITCSISNIEPPWQYKTTMEISKQYVFSEAPIVTKKGKVCYNPLRQWPYTVGVVETEGLNFSNLCQK